MKNRLIYIFLGLLLVGGLSLFAFRQNNEYEPDYEYAELLGFAVWSADNIMVTVDFGLAKPQPLKDPMGKTVKFNSMIDAFNHMARDGWQFQQAYVVTYANKNVYHWLMKRKIQR